MYQKNIITIDYNKKKNQFFVVVVPSMLNIGWIEVEINLIPRILSLNTIFLFSISYSNQTFSNLSNDIQDKIKDRNNQYIYLFRNLHTITRTFLSKQTVKKGMQNK